MCLCMSAADLGMRCEWVQEPWCCASGRAAVHIVLVVYNVYVYGCIE